LDTILKQARHDAKRTEEVSWVEEVNTLLGLETFSALVGS